MNIIFAGTSDFGIPTLEKIKNDYNLDLIITNPDKPTGRNQKLTASPVKLWAQSNNIPIEQPEKLSTVNCQLSAVKPDLLLVIAYGKKIPKDILDIPKFGSINVHGSLLPKYRGASPIQAALLNGDQETGITIIKMDEEIDHGPIIASKKVPIDPKDNFLSLYKKLSNESSLLVSATLPKWFNGQIEVLPQNHGQATFTKLLTKDDGRIQWNLQAQNIVNKIHALNPKPGTWTTLNGKSIRILEAEISQENKIELPGKLLRLGQNLGVKCGDYNLQIVKIQPDGKHPMTGKDFLNGLKNLESKIFI